MTNILLFVLILLIQNSLIACSYIVEDSIPILNVTDVNFGNCPPGSEYEKIITVSNKGKSELIITGFSQKYSPQIFNFSIWNGNQKIKISPGDSLLLSLKFSPLDPLLYYDSLTFHSNALSGDSVAYVKGRGIPWLGIKEEIHSDKEYEFVPSVVNGIEELSILHLERFTNIVSFEIVDNNANQIYLNHRFDINSFDFEKYKLPKLSTGLYFIRITVGFHQHISHFIVQ